MTTDEQNINRDRQLIMDAKAKGRGATLWAYTRLSGPGWLQSAITLGGGSLTSSLYLGVLAGFALLWLQPVAMILGIVMLSAISYVTLSTGKRPFQAINEHVNPVLGWGWAIATLLANCVWSLPQFSLGTAAIRQNLLPGVLGEKAMDPTQANLIVAGSILVVCALMVWFYDRGGWGVKVFNIVLKLMVGLIVISFFGVVIRMSLTKEGLEWGKILGGFIPDIRLLWSPATTFNDLIDAVDPKYHVFWRGLIVREQQKVMISAAATAVGINMTFLLPYSMLRRGWDKTFRGLAVFDLSTGLFIPFLLTTACVVIASAAQFHTKPAEGILEAARGNTEIVVPKNIAAGYKGIALKRVQHEVGEEAFGSLSDAEKEARIDQLPEADRMMAAVLVRRDAFNLASSLEQLTGRWIAHWVFGIGVVGMAVSSIIILMLINGFTVCEMLGCESRGWVYRLGSLMPCIGILGPFIWGGLKAKLWIAIPTSMFGMVLLPVAYFAFYMLMNQPALLGDNMPRGGKRFVFNALMALAAVFALLGCIWSLRSSLADIPNVWWRGAALALVLGYLALVIIVQIFRRKGKTT